MARESSGGRRWVQLGLLGAALFVPVAAAGNGPVPGSAASLRARASQLFRAKKFAAACPLFEAAARLSPGEPEILADLALCQHRLGSDELSRQTNLDAIARASESAKIQDPHFARIRRHAYFNLADLSFEPGEELSVSGDQSCRRLTATPGCSKTFNECSVSRAAGGQTYRSSTLAIRVALTQEAASFADREPAADPDFEGLGTPSADLPVLVDSDDAFDYVGSFSEEELTYKCEWTCEGSSAVAEEVSKCPSSPKRSAAARENCERAVCERAERSPWAAVTAERAEKEACYAYATSVDGEYQCGVVYSNACTGLVGLVCSGHAGGEKEMHTRVEEYLFRTPVDASTR